MSSSSDCVTEFMQERGCSCVAAKKLVGLRILVEEDTEVEDLDVWSVGSDVEEFDVVVDVGVGAVVERFDGEVDVDVGALVEGTGGSVS